MHTINPDIVSMKTVVRQLASRLEVEAKSSEQWASYARNRGLPEAAVRLDLVTTALKEAFVNAEAAAERLFEAQEHEVSGHEDHVPEQPSS